MRDLEDRLAEALRYHRHEASLGCSCDAVLAEYDAAHRKPDAAERAMQRWCNHRPSEYAPELARIIREEIARDNAERDARDREREEAVREYIRRVESYTSAFRDDATPVRRAFGWNQEDR